MGAKLREGLVECRGNGGWEEERGREEFGTQRNDYRSETRVNCPIENKITYN